jgi:hypothetical protein
MKTITQKEADGHGTTTAVRTTSSSQEALAPPEWKRGGLALLALASLRHTNARGTKRSGAFFVFIHGKGEG